jgi:hypothetical protein
MDYLKTRAPFWKRERTADGSQPLGRCARERCGCGARLGDRLTPVGDPPVRGRGWLQKCRYGLFDVLMDGTRSGRPVRARQGLM